MTFTDQTTSLESLTPCGCTLSVRLVFFSGLLIPWHCRMLKSVGQKVLNNFLQLQFCQIVSASECILTCSYLHIMVSIVMACTGTGMVEGPCEQT